MDHYFPGDSLLASMCVISLLIVGMYIIPPTFDHLQENTCKYFWCCTRLAASVLREVFLIIYVTLKTDNGHMSLYEYCQKVGVSPDGQFRFADQRQKLRCDPVKEFMDVTFLCQVITSVLPRCNVQVPQSVKSIANELRQRRNKICHEDIVMDDVSLRNEFKNFQGLFAEALSEAGRITGKDVSDRIQTIQKEMDRVIAAKVLENSEQLRSEMSLIKNGRAGTAITTTRRNLMSALRDLKKTGEEVAAYCQPLNKPKDIPKLMKDSSEIPLRQLIVAAFKIRKSNKPAVLILWSSRKETRKFFLTHLLNEWSTKSRQIYALDSYDFMIFIDGDENHDRRLSTCKHSHISFSNKETNDLLREMKVLFLLNDLDPGSNLLEEFLQEFPEGHVILTSPSVDRFRFESVVQKANRSSATLQLIDKNQIVAELLAGMRK